MLGNFWATFRYKIDPNYQKGLYLEVFFIKSGQN